MMDSSVVYDHRSFSVRGTPTLILSGSVHYPRLHPSRWQALFDTFHAAHLNTLETYVFWHEHDNTPPTLPSFSDRLDLFAFLSAAHKNNLFVILRIGPYVCAEVNYGGFPFRLRNIPGIKFRTQNKPFQGQVENWVRHISAKLHKHSLLASQGGPIILVQLENEYSMISDAYGDNGTQYLQWMADLQRQLNFGVPAIMCYGAAEGVVETINAFYAHQKLPDQRLRHPDQPPIWTECWTGWYDVWGAPHHVRPVEDLAYAVARFFAAGGAGLNYYMWMGGTNFGRSGMYLQKTSYDYDAPVDEFYQITTKGKHLARLHSVLLERFSGEFMMEREKEPKGEEGVFWWGDVAFICNDSEKANRKVRLRQGFIYEGDMRAKSVHIVDKEGKLLFDTAFVAEEDVVKKTRRQVEVDMVEKWQVLQEPVPRQENLELSVRGRLRVASSKPAEQLGLTQDNTDYCFYTARYARTEETVEDRTWLEFEAADFAHVFVDGKLVGTSKTPLWEDRWENKWNQYSENEPGVRNRMQVGLKGDKVDITVLVAALGLVKGDWQLEQGKNMLDEQKGLLSDVTVEGYSRVGDWTAVSGLVGEATRCWEEFKGDPAELRCEGMCWYHCKVRVRETASNWLLDLGGCGKGVIYVNGHLLGRYWLVEGVRPMNGFLNGSPVKQVNIGEPSQRYYHVPAWMGRHAGDGVELAFTFFAETGSRPENISISVTD